MRERSGGCRRRRQSGHRLRLDPAADRDAEPALQPGHVSLWTTAPIRTSPINGGWTPLYLATDNRNIESGDYPVRNAGHGSSRLHQAAARQGRECECPRSAACKSTPTECNGDTTETRTNFTMQWLYEDGATPFLRAAQSGDVKLMKLLLEQGRRSENRHGAQRHTRSPWQSGIGWVEGVTFEWSPAQESSKPSRCVSMLGIDVNAADDRRPHRPARRRAQRPAPR